MSKKEGLSAEISDIKQEVESYIQNRIDLTKLHIAEDLSRFISSIAVRLILFYIAFFVLLFLSMAGAYYLGRLLNNTELGFVIIASFYFLVGLIFILLKGKLIQSPIIKSLIHLFFPNYNQYEK